MPVNDPLMRESELKKWILRRLGDPLLKVELTDEHLDDAIREARRWFAARKGMEKQIAVTLISGTAEYQMPEDCDAVTDVSFSSDPVDTSLIFAPQVMAGEMFPYTIFNAPRPEGTYSTFVQALQYLSMARRILGADANWLYKPYNKTLIVFPHTNTGSAIIEYKSAVSALELLPERDHDLIKRYALAWAKRDLGEMRSKYSAYPTAQGQTQLNGMELLQQAQLEFQQLNEEIIDSAFPMAILRG